MVELNTADERAPETGVVSTLIPGLLGLAALGLTAFGVYGVATDGPLAQTYFGPPGIIGRSRQAPMLRTRSYMTKAPARLTLMQNLVGIFTT